MQEMNSIVAIYETPVDAVQGVTDLQKAGFNMMKLSIVAREDQGSERIIGYCHTTASTKYWGKMGAIWGGLGGYLSGAAFFVLPELGPVLMAGPLVAAVAASLEGESENRSAGAFGAGLRSLGIPRESIQRYESELCADRFLVIAHGGAEGLLQAKSVLHMTRPSELNLHFVEEAARIRR